MVDMIFCNHGSALASVLILTSASLVTLTMFLSLVVDLRDQSILTRRKLVLAQVSENIADLIQNDGSWQAIINPSANASFNCLKSPELGCPTGGSDMPGYIPFQLMQADGQAAFPPPNQGPGFTEQGEPCQGASAVSGSGRDSCPFAILVRWKRDCGPLVPCQDVYADVRIDFFYNPKTVRPGIAINTQPFSIKTIRSPYTGNILARGTLEPTTAVVSAQGYDAAESAFFKETQASKTLYLPPDVTAATLHVNATGIATVDASAQRTQLVNKKIYSFRNRSFLCAILNDPFSKCLQSPSQNSAVDSSAPNYYTPGDKTMLVTGNAGLIRSLAGSKTPHYIRGLFRVEAILPQANPVWPQLERLRLEYTVYR